MQLRCIRPPDRIAAAAGCSAIANSDSKQLHPLSSGPQAAGPLRTRARIKKRNKKREHFELYSAAKQGIVRERFELFKKELQDEISHKTTHSFKTHLLPTTCIFSTFPSQK